MAKSESSTFEECDNNKCRINTNQWRAKWEHERALADRLAKHLDEAQWAWSYYESSTAGCYKCPECEAVHFLSFARKHADKCSLAATLAAHAERRKSDVLSNKKGDL